MMQLAFYRADQGRFFDKLINLWTGRRGFSHVELVFSDGISYSASNREGRVRYKHINYNKDRWVFKPLLHITAVQERAIRAEADNHLGKKYDWCGIFFHQGIPLGWQNADKWWCSELVAALLGHRPFRISPNALAKLYL